MAHNSSFAGGGTSGTVDRTAAGTPAIGDLLVVFCNASGNTNAAPVCTDNQGGTYDLIGTALWSTSANICSVFVRKQLVKAAVSHTITVATGSNTAAEIVVDCQSGMYRTGSAAVRSSGFQANKLSGSTPTPVLNQAALTGNPTIWGVASGVSTGTTPNASWTERQDVFQSTPTTAAEIATRDSGFTGTSVAAGATQGSAYASFVIELDASWPWAGAYPLTAAALASATTGLGFGTWTNAGIYTCDESSGNLASQINSLTLTASGTPTYSIAGPLGGLDTAVSSSTHTSNLFARTTTTDFDPGTHDLLGVVVFQVSSASFGLLNKNAGSSPGYFINSTASVVSFQVGDVSHVTAVATMTAPPTLVWAVMVFALDRGANNIAVSVYSPGGYAQSVVSAAAVGDLTTSAALQLLTDGGVGAASTIAYAAIVAGSGVAASVASNITNATFNFVTALNRAVTHPTITASADAKIQTTRTITAIADAKIQQQGRTVTSSADAKVQTTRTVTTGADAKVKTSLSATASADAVTTLSATTRTLTSSADAKTQQQGRTVAANADAKVAKTNAITASADAKVKTSLSLTSNADAKVKTSVSLTSSTDAKIKTGVSLTASADSKIKTSVSLTSSADAKIRTSRSITASADAKIQTTRNVTAGANASIAKTNTVTASADAKIKTTISTTTSADAKIQTTRSASASVDAKIQQQGRTATASADAKIRTSRSLTASADAKIQTTRTIATTANAAVAKTNTVAAGVDAKVQSTRTVTASVDTKIQTSRTVTAGADADVKTTQTVAVGADAKIKTSASLTASADAKVQTTRSITASADADVAKTNTVAASVDAKIQQGRTASASADASIAKTNTINASADAKVQSTRPITAAVDAKVQKTGIAITASADADVKTTRNTTSSADAKVQASLFATAVTDATVQSTRSIAAGADADVSSSESVSTDTEAVVTSSDALSADADARVQTTRAVASTVDSKVQTERTALASTAAAVATTSSISASGDAMTIAQTSPHVETLADSAVMSTRSVASQINAVIETTRFAWALADAVVVERAPPRPTLPGGGVYGTQPKKPAPSPRSDTVEIEIEVVFRDGDRLVDPRAPAVAVTVDGITSRLALGNGLRRISPGVYALTVRASSARAAIRIDTNPPPIAKPARAPVAYAMAEAERGMLLGDLRSEGVRLEASASDAQILGAHTALLRQGGPALARRLAARRSERAMKLAQLRSARIHAADDASDAFLDAALAELDRGPTRRRS